MTEAEIIAKLEADKKFLQDFITLQQKMAENQSTTICQLFQERRKLNQIYSSAWSSITEINETLEEACAICTTEDIVRAARLADKIAHDTMRKFDKIGYPVDTTPEHVSLDPKFAKVSIEFVKTILDWMNGWGDHDEAACNITDNLNAIIAEAAPEAE